jgi:hypothetical protein
MNQKTRQMWHFLFQLATENGVSLTDPRQLQVLMRQFAMLQIKAQPENDRIEIGGQTLIRFPNVDFRSKQDYIAYHSRNGAWGDDAILASTLYALGYESTVFLADTNFPPYQLFEHPEPVATIEIANHGALRGGTHWSLLTESTPGDGNCMYHTIAQQLVHDIPRIAAELGVHIASAPNSAQARAATHVEEAPIGANVIQAFAEQTHRDQMTYDRTSAILSQYTLPELVQAYQHALTLTDGDTYLARRPHFVSEETGSKFLEVLLASNDTAKVLSGFDDVQSGVARGELVHMLAKECWRNPKAAAVLDSFHRAESAVVVLVTSCADEVRGAAPLPVDHLAPGVH